MYSYLQELSQKRDHFSSYCFSKDVSLLREDDNLELEEDAFLECLESLGETQCHATVNLNQKDVKFKLDTGVKVTAISEVPFTFSFLHNTKLKESTKTLWPSTHCTDSDRTIH